MTATAPAPPAPGTLPVDKPRTRDQRRWPPDIRIEIDEVRREWTDINSAAKLAQVSRRTIYYWWERGWLVVKRTASGRPRILVESLWKAEDE